MISRNPRSGWHAKLIRPRFPWSTHHPRAAEVGEALSSVMLSRKYSLEDAEYQKIVPNEFVVELHQENYSRNYQPIEERVLQQWHAKMMERLATANSRLGRNLYQISAPLHLEIRPVADLKPTQARILCRVQPSGSGAPSGDEQGESIDIPRTACLETLSGKRRWLLRSNTVTVGRDIRCDIYLDMSDVQEKRLISSEHALLRFEQGGYYIYDGSPDGKPSVNGTFVNQKPVPPEGQLLEEGDTILLAALDRNDPRSDVPGVLELRFRRECS
jgi:hypothetical protein